MRIRLSHKIFNPISHAVLSMALQGELKKYLLGDHSSSSSLADKDKPSLYRFADTPQPPDPFLTDDYLASHRSRGTTIVIDNGLLKLISLITMTVCSKVRVLQRSINSFFTVYICTHTCTCYMYVHVQVDVVS